MLLRDLAQGKHADWLQSMVLLIASDLQRRRQRARHADEPRPAERPGRRHGPAAERAEPRPQPRPHEARLARRPLAFVKLMNDYDPHVSRGSAHDQRLASRLLPDLRAAAEPGDRSRDHRPPAKAVAPGVHQDHQVEVRLGLLLLRQRDGGGRGGRGEGAAVGPGAQRAAGETAPPPAQAPPAASASGRPSTTGRASTTATSACATASRS